VKIVKSANCCAVLLSCVALCCGQAAPQPVGATLCDLYQRPEEYAGKVVKVRGASVGDLRIESTLHDSSAKPCSAYMRLIVVFPDQVKPAPAFQLIRDESYEKLDQALRSPEPVHIDATYEGRFDPVFVWRDHKRIRVGQGHAKSHWIKHQYDGRIVLRQVSDVWTMRPPHR
jgi:hypothetical protein